MRVFVPLLTLALLTACQSPQARVESGTVPASDDVPIAYDVRGQGDTALVFVHCWCCNRDFWRDQLDVFADTYRVVALDLPGHGLSGAERERWTLDAYARDVQSVVDRLMLKRVILIGHSMGGPVSLKAAALMPKQTIGVVLVDTVHNAEFDMHVELIEQFAAQFESDFAGTMGKMVPTMFPPGSDQQLIDWVIEQALATNQTAAVAVFRDFPDADIPATLAAVKAPVRAINAAPAKGRAMPTEVEINRKYADYDAVLIDGIGHYLMLELPAEFNEHLRAVLAAIDSR